MKNFIIIMILFFTTFIPLFYISSDQMRKFLTPSLIVCVVLVTLAGIYLPNIELYFGAIVLIFLATVRGRLDAVCRYILLAAIIPQIQWRIGAAGHYLGVIDSAGALGATAYVIAKFDRRRPSGSTGGWATEDSLVLVIFLIMAIGTTGFGKFDDTLRSWIQQFLLIVTPYILFRSTLKSTSDYRAAIACFGAASVFLAVFSIFEAWMSADIFDIITKHLTGIYIRPMNMRGGFLRASATMGGPLALACFMTVGIFALACSRSFFRNAIGYYGSLGVAAAGLYTTQSRGSVIAVFGAAVVLALALRKWGVAAAAAMVAIAAWPTLQILANMSPAVASFINGGAPANQGKYFDYRNLLLERGLQVAAGHPITGMRLTQVLDALADIAQGEGIVDMVNVYLEILLISGIVGLLPFLGLSVASGLRGSFGFRRIHDPALLRARGFTLAAFTVVLFQLSFVSFIDRMPMLLVLNLFGIRLLVQERKSLRRPAVMPLEPGQPADDALPASRADRDMPSLPRLPMASA